MRSTITLQSLQSDGDQTNVNIMWELQKNRKHHLSHLEAIYKDKNSIRLKSEKSQEQRRQTISNFQRKKMTDMNHRNKVMQDKINHENTLLRNKLIDVLSDRRKSHSVGITRTNPYRRKKIEEMYETNLKFGARLSNIKSEVMNNSNLKEHFQKTGMYLEMIQKKSPKKKAYLRSLVHPKGKNQNPSKILSAIDSSIYTLQ